HVLTLFPYTTLFRSSSYKRALKRMVGSGTYNPEDPLVLPIRRDMQYKSFKKVTKPQTQAVVIYMMDVSGSMGDEQKEIVRLESLDRKSTRLNSSHVK